MQGFPQDYNFLQGSTTNRLWVTNYQDPFNKNVLTPAAAMGQTNPAGAYAMLAPAFAKIKNDAINFVATALPSQQSDAKATIEGWKKDWPLIQGFLDAWAPAAAAAQPTAVVASPAGSTQPSTIFQDQGAPAVYSNPSIFTPAAPSVSTPYQAPATVNVSTPAGGGLDVGQMFAAGLSDYVPWIAGAVVLGLLLSRPGRRA